MLSTTNNNLGPELHGIFGSFKAESSLLGCSPIVPLFLNAVGSSACDLGCRGRGPLCEGGGGSTQERYTQVSHNLGLLHHSYCNAGFSSKVGLLQHSCSIQRVKQVKIRSRNSPRPAIMNFHNRHCQRSIFSHHGTRQPMSWV